MTLIAVRNAVLSHFCNEDTLTVDQFPTISLPDDLKDRRDQVLRVVLKDLEEQGMVRSLIPDKLEGYEGARPDMWVLTSPIGAGGQTLRLSLPTAVEVAGEINAYKDFHDRKDWPDADAMNLDESNVMMLLAIIAHLAGTEPGEDDPENPSDPSAN